jgi:hypothetical protein
MKMMKLAWTTAMLLLCSGAAFGQADAKPQEQCRPLKSGDFIASNESIVGSGSNMMVCPRSAREETVQPAAVQPVAVSKSDADPAPAGAVGPRVTPRVSSRGGPRVTLGAERRVQFAGGYEYDSVNVSGYGSSTPRVNTNGVFLQAMGNVSPYLAVVGDVDGIYKKDPTLGSLYLITYTGGVQANPIGHGSWTPFVRGTAGAGTIHVQGFGNTTGFAWQMGGGLDYHFRHESRLGLRLGQFDYGQMRKNGVSLNSIKFGAGITF